MHTIIIIISYGLACLTLGYCLASVPRKVMAPKKHLNYDPCLWTRGILPHRRLYTDNENLRAIVRSARVRSERAEARGA